MDYDALMCNILSILFRYNPNKELKPTFSSHMPVVSLQITAILKTLLSYISF